MRAPTEADVARLVEIAHERDRLTGHASTVTADDILFDWREPGFDPQRDIRLAVVGEEIVGRAAVNRDELEEEQRMYGGGYVVPAHRGKGIGTALMDWLSETARSAGARELRTGVNPKEADALAFVEARGFEHVRTFHYLKHRDPAGLEALQWPQGVTVRNDLSGDELVDALVLAHDGSFIDHYNFSPASREQFANWLTHPDCPADLCFVAYGASGEIAGSCWCFIEDRGPLRRGVVGQLGTTRPFRGIGLGKALLRCGVRALVARGATEVGISVDSENPSGALGLYERTDFVVEQSNRVYRAAL